MKEQLIMTIFLIGIILILGGTVGWAWSINNDLLASLQDLERRVQAWEDYYDGGDDDEPEDQSFDTNRFLLEEELTSQQPYSNLMALRVEVA